MPDTRISKYPTEQTEGDLTEITCPFCGEVEEDGRCVWDAMDSEMFICKVCGQTSHVSVRLFVEPEW